MLRQTKYHLLMLMALLFLFVLLMIRGNVFLVKSGSMEDTVFSGDAIMIKRYTVPYSGEANFFGRICIFSANWMGKPENFIKRCVGIPGDTMLSAVKSTSKVINLNRKDIATVDHIKRKFVIHFDSGRHCNIFKIAKDSGVSPYSMMVNRKNKNIEMNVTISQAQKMKEGCPGFKMFFLEDSFDVENIKMDTFVLTKTNHSQISCLGQANVGLALKPILFDSLAGSNAFFFVGDNRELSEDSRHYGPILESQIKGIAWLVLFSWDQENHSFRWDRFLKKL